MVAEHEATTEEVDLTSEVCPMTFVRAKLHLDGIAVGETLTLVLLSGEQMRNVPQSLREEGHRIESVCQDGDRYRLLVRRGE
jgi:tRNA 2-thiouridine synthesizing protein A